MEANLHYQLSYRLSAIDFLETSLFIRKASVAKFRYIFAIFSLGYEDGYASYRQWEWLVSEMFLYFSLVSKIF